MDQLVVLGPTFLLKVKHQPKDFDRRVTIEMWLYPDGSRIMEISTKCAPKEAFQVAAEFKAYLATTASHSPPTSLRRPRPRWSSTALGSRRRRCPADAPPCCSKGCPARSRLAFKLVTRVVFGER